MKIKGRILHIDKHYKFVGIGLKVFKYSHSFNKKEMFVNLSHSFLKSLISSWHLTERLFRASIHHFMQDGYDGYFIIFDKFICRVDSKGQFIGVVNSLKGSRPLCCTVKNGSLYYGEYTSNSERKSIGLYCFSGSKTELIYTFENVRHIHGVFFNKQNSIMYVTTGDFGSEAAIWKMNDGTFEVVCGGSQQYRAVQLLFKNGLIYYGTDTPLEQNYIYSFDENKKDVKILGRVSSSVFYGSKIGDKLLFSTAVEPSKFNKTSEVEVWLVENNEPKLLISFVKDKLNHKYFQYGQAIFPNYSEDSECSEVWVYLLGVRGSGYSVCIAEL